MFVMGCVHAMAHVWKSEDYLKHWSLVLPYLRQGLLCAHQAIRTVNFGNSPASASTFLWDDGDYRSMHHCVQLLCGFQYQSFNH